MNILIFGAGVQGQHLAHALNKPENNITIFARGKTYERLKNRGIVLHHYLQRKDTVDEFNYIEELKESDAYDIIFVTMKYSHYYSIIPTLANNISQNIVFVGNNSNPRKLRQTILEQTQIPKNIAFGFSISGGIREDNVTNILRFNAGELKVSYLDGGLPFRDKLNQVFSNLPIKLTYTSNFESWLMSHAAMVTPMNMGIFLKDQYKGNQSVLINDVIRATNELHMLLEHSGYQIIPRSQKILFKNFKFLARPLLKLSINMNLLSQIPNASGFTELEAIYDDMKALNKHTALTTPKLDKLMKQLQATFK